MEEGSEGTRQHDRRLDVKRLDDSGGVFEGPLIRVAICPGVDRDRVSEQLVEGLAQLRVELLKDRTYQAQKEREVLLELIRYIHDRDSRARNDLLEFPLAKTAIGHLGGYLILQLVDL